MLSYEEVINLPTKRAWSYTYGIYQDTRSGGDEKIYNVDQKNKIVLYSRDPLNLKFKVGDIVLSKRVGEYGEIIGIKQDLDWGNHQYDVDFFNEIFESYQDEQDLQLVS